MTAAPTSDPRAHPTSRTHARLLAATLLVALLHAWLSAIVRPPFQVSDEISYFAAAQAASQGYLTAVPPEVARTLVFDGPSGKIVFRAVAGSALALLERALPPVWALVGLRLLLGLSLPLLVYATWRLARRVAPANSLVIWGAPLLVALHPVVVIFAGGVTPDSLANAFAACALWLAADWIELGGRWRFASATGLVALAIGSKDTAFALVVPVAAAPLLRARLRRDSGRRAGRAPHRRSRAIAAAITAVVLVGLMLFAWSVLRPQILQRAMTSGSSPDAQLRAGVVERLIVELPGYFHSYWASLGNFGAMPLYLPDPLFAGVYVVCLLAAAGVLLTAVDRPAWCRQPADWPRVRLAIGVLAATLVGLAFQAPVRELLTRATNLFQGRWLFPMAGGTLVLLCIGVSWPLPRPGRALPLAAWLASTVAIVALLATVVPFYYASFPTEYNPEHLYLSGSYGLPANATDVGRYVERPPVADAPAIVWLAAAAWIAAIANWFVAWARERERFD